MQFEALKVFCDVARLRSFSQAAAVNHLSQSAASQIVSQLEKRLGVHLIDRSTRPLQMTDPGRTYYEGCKRLVDQFLNLEASVRREHAQLTSSVQVAAIYSVGLSDMDRYVERFHRLQLSAQVHIDYLHPDRVYERVLDGSADIGLVSFPRRSRELIALPWREEEMVLVCPPTHRLARQAEVQIDQLRNERYIAFNRDLVIRKEVDRFLREQDVQVDVAMEFDNIENIKKAIEVSGGIALLPEPTLRREVEAGTLRAIELQHAHFLRPLGIVYRRNHKLGPAAQRFLDLLRQPLPPPPQARTRLGQGRVTPGNGNGRSTTTATVKDRTKSK